MTKKNPPAEKVYEAFSAVADSRIRMYEDYALIDSSDRSKTYEVSWKDDVYASSDNATYWQGYPGYPVIAVLMMQGKLTLPDDAYKMKDVPWKQLNDKHKRNYAEAAEEALRMISERGTDISGIRESAGAVYEELINLQVKVKRGKNNHSKE
ncbi:MAG: hypothetical protein K6D03_10090 [Solobacterium sp.]|nr:hypothetical protein [Solobacterium sp.]